MKAAVAAALVGVAAAAMAQGEDVPFITTPDNVTLAMLELARVGPNDHVIDLGSGDGRIVITAARRFGATGLGVEIVPELVAKSRDAARSAGVGDRTEFRVQDLYATDLSRATVVTMYLLPEVNLQLKPRLQQLAPGTRIVSHDWDLGDWTPDRTITVAAPDKAVGREKSSRLHLWVVPARLAGHWCGRGPWLSGVRMSVTQAHQHATGVVDLPDATTLAMTGTIAGSRWPTVGDGPSTADFEWRDGRLYVTGAAGTTGMMRGMVFVPVASPWACR